MSDQLLDKLYDFESAKRRVQELKDMFRRLAVTQEPNGSWEWWISNEIADLELEIEIMRNAA